MNVYIHIYIYIYIYIHTYTYIYAYAYTHIMLITTTITYVIRCRGMYSIRVDGNDLAAIYLALHVYYIIIIISSNVYIYIYICIYTFMYIHIYMFIHKYIHTYIHTYISTLAKDRACSFQRWNKKHERACEMLRSLISTLT